MDDESAHWQQFRGTELGSLLTTLYGNPRPAVNYPKLKTKGGEFQPASKYTSSGAKVVVPTKRNVSVAVPRLTGMPCGQEEQPTRRAPVDCIARRKQADKIKAEIDDIKMRDSYYRGPMTKVINTRTVDFYDSVFGTSFSALCTQHITHALSHPMTHILSTPVTLAMT